MKLSSINFFTETFLKIVLGIVICVFSNLYILSLKKMWAITTSTAGLRLFLKFFGCYVNCAPTTTGMMDPHLTIHFQGKRRLGVTSDHNS